MTKKWAVLLVIVGEALVYLFLLVGLPAIESAFICDTCNVREVFGKPLLLYLTPGLIGLLLLVLIWKQRKGGKDDVQDLSSNNNS